MTGPKIRAAFVTDDRGRPYSSDDGRHTHYRIVLYLENIPEGTQSVTYKLHGTYGDRRREVGRGPGLEGEITFFEEEITSYGDFTIKALVQTATGSDLITAPLVEALRETYATDPNPEILTAITVLETQ